MRRVYLNIGAFVVLTTAAIAWSTVNFLHLDAIERPMLVTAEFEQSPGLRAGYEVTYLGHAIGNVRGVELVPGMSEVRLAIDRDVEIPADVVAAARRRSAIGEPYVDLAPRPGTDPHDGPRLEDGARIVLVDTTSPLQYGDLFRSLDVLVSTIDADALGTVVDELAIAVDGRGDDLRRTIQGVDDLTATLSENGDAIEGLIDDVAVIVDVLATNRDSLGSGIESLAGLTEALEAARPAAEALLDEGPTSIALLNSIADAADHAVICVVDGAAALDAVLDGETLRSLTGLLQRSAAFADVVDLVQDERDGIFRLYVSPSGGNPPTVEYAAPEPYPSIPTRQSCEGAHDVDVAAEPVADEAPRGAGGTRPGADTERDASPRPGAAPVDLASGTSDAASTDGLLERVVGLATDALPLAAVAGAGALLVFLIVRRRRRT